jgi:hypothetical protein
MTGLISLVVNCLCRHDVVLFTAFRKSEFREPEACAVTVMFLHVMPQRNRAVLCMGTVRAWRCVVYRAPNNGKISFLFMIED